MPNVLIEAMCMGMPVLSTDCPSGGPRELIRDGENGLLVPVNDAGRMADAMQRIIEPGSETMGKNAYLTGKKLTDPSVFQRWSEELFGI